MGYKESVQRLFDLQKFGMKFGLDSMRRILSKLGNPERGGKYVHVAGTNGKGSTLANMAAVLESAGYKTGLYTSPHLASFRERIRINGRLISSSRVEELAERVWEAVDPGAPPTFFEFATAMAFIYFKEEGCSPVLIETGLGGRLDSTNVLEPLISAVTNIGLEHTEHLGDTIEKIAFEKAGVIKEGRPFAAGRLVPEALKVIEERARELNAKVKLLGRDYELVSRRDSSGGEIFHYRGTFWNYRDLELGLKGEHQADNAALALAILEELSRTGFPIEAEDLRLGLKNALWPGRGEVFPPGSWPPDKSGKAPLILDGAHNPDGSRAFARHLSGLRKGKGLTHMICGVMADKDLFGVLGPLSGAADRLYLTRPQYHRAAEPEVLLQSLKGLKEEPGKLQGLFPSIPEAVEAAAKNASGEDLVALSGSLFTVGEAWAWLTGVTETDSN
jgi:dihydrofolate synthase/folylpolyglutamate synthase